jgi:hypothetical protein
MKFFKTKHDRIVLMHLQGHKNIEIADELGLTPQRVHQVLTDPSALMQINRFRQQLRAKAQSDIEMRMLSLGAAAVGNIAETIEANVPVGSRVKKHQDDVSIKLLDRLGYTPRSDRAKDDEGGIKMDRDLQERLVSAMESTRVVHQYDAAEEVEYHLEDQPPPVFPASPRAEGAPIQEISATEESNV